MALFAYSAAGAVGAQLRMAAKTHFSVALFYPAESVSTQPQRDRVMQSLEPSLTALFAAADKAATVTVSSSHKGPDNRLVDVVTVLQDAQIAETLTVFCNHHGLVWEAFE